MNALDQSLVVLHVGAFRDTVRLVCVVRAEVDNNQVCRLLFAKVPRLRVICK